jgi:hypothetical protein
MKGIRYQIVKALVLIVDKTKTIQTGFTQYASCIRNKRVDICAVGALALYLFCRFHVSLEPFPSLWGNADRFNLKLFSGRDVSLVNISYVTQRGSVKKIIEKVGFTTSSTTHIGRKSGAMKPSLASVPKDEIQRAGGWNQDALSKQYLQGLPQQALRGMAGFPNGKGTFFLAGTSTRHLCQDFSGCCVMV